MYTIFTRKPIRMEDVEHNMQYSHLKEWVDIVEELILSPEQYESFWESPVCAYYEFLKGKGGYRSGQRTAVLLICEGKRSIVVDPSGYAYGRYVGFKCEDEAF